MGGKWQTNEEGEGTASQNSTQIYDGGGSYSVGLTLFEITESGDSGSSVDETFTWQNGDYQIESLSGSHAITDWQETQTGGSSTNMVNGDFAAGNGTYHNSETSFTYDDVRHSNSTSSGETHCKSVGGVLSVTKFETTTSDSRIETTRDTSTTSNWGSA